MRVTHDIKGHLAAIKGFLGIVEDKEVEQLDSHKADLVHRAYARAVKLTDFVKKLLRLTQMRLSNILEMDTFSLNDTLRNAVSTVKAKAEDKSITLKCNIESSVGRIVGNQFSIEEMVTNLLLNAVKYTPANGTVGVSAEDRKDCIFVQITDTGIGVPIDEQSKIFDEFYRADNAKTVERDGTGLGLSIVKHIVERHGGEIRVQSKESSGTTFTVRLPKGQHSNPQPKQKRYDITCLRDNAFNSGKTISVNPAGGARGGFTPSRSNSSFWSELVRYANSARQT